MDAKPNAREVRDYLDSCQWIGHVADPEEVGDGSDEEEVDEEEGEREEGDPE